MPSEMGKFKIRSVASLAAFVVIVLSLAGACNGTDDSSKTASVIGSVVFDCNACSEHLLAFSGAHVAIKCRRDNDLSANGAGSVNADGSFAIHLDKVELGDLCSAEVVMPHNKLCSLAKTSALSTLEKLSISTPLKCNDAKETLDQKFSTVHPPIPNPNFKLSINFPTLHVTPRFLTPKLLTVTKFIKANHPLNPQFFKTKPLTKLPPLPPTFKPKPFSKPNFFTSPPPHILKPKLFLKPNLPKDPLTPQFFKTKPLPKLFPWPPIFNPKPFPKPHFFKPKPFPKPNFFKPKIPPLPPIFKPKPFPKPNFFKPKPFPKPNFFKPPLIPPIFKPIPFPKPKLPPLPPILKPKLYPKPKFLKPPSPKP